MSGKNFLLFKMKDLILSIFKRYFTSYSASNQPVSLIILQTQNRISTSWLTISFENYTLDTLKSNVLKFLRLEDEHSKRMVHTTKSNKCNVEEDKIFNKHWAA